jgi:membrane protease subunit (stomatin/prohibitin family)
MRAPADFTYSIPDKLSSAAAAPLMCAGEGGMGAAGYSNANSAKRQQQQQQQQQQEEVSDQWSCSGQHDTANAP